LEYGYDRNRGTEESMSRIEDYSDEELKDELLERGYVLYKGEDMRECVEKLKGLQDGLIGKLEKLKRR
jgi:hypothetical protein